MGGSSRIEARIALSRISFRCVIPLQLCNHTIGILEKQLYALVASQWEDMGLHVEKLSGPGSRESRKGLMTSRLR